MSKPRTNGATPHEPNNETVEFICDAQVAQLMRNLAEARKMSIREAWESAARLWLVTPE